MPESNSQRPNNIKPRLIAWIMLPVPPTPVFVALNGALEFLSAFFPIIRAQSDGEIRISARSFTAVTVIKSEGVREYSWIIFQGPDRTVR